MIMLAACIAFVPPTLIVVLVLVRNAYEFAWMGDYSTAIRVPRWTRWVVLTSVAVALALILSRS